MGYANIPVRGVSSEATAKRYKITSIQIDKATGKIIVVYET